jgi:hypothetical protein
MQITLAVLQFLQEQRWMDGQHHSRPKWQFAVNRTGLKTTAFQEMALSPSSGGQDVKNCYIFGTSNYSRFNVQSLTTALSRDSAKE